jgi:uncharacterized Tic20 family protein
MTTSGLVTRDDKLWATAAHVAGFAGYVFALGQYIAPLVLFFVFKDKSKFVAFHALQSLFFQLLVLVAGTLSGLLTHLLVGYLLLAVVAIAAIVYPILVARRAFVGEWAEYWLVGRWARQIVG